MKGRVAARNPTRGKRGGDLGAEHAKLGGLHSHRRDLCRLWKCRGGRGVRGTESWQQGRKEKKGETCVVSELMGDWGEKAEAA